MSGHTAGERRWFRCPLVRLVATLAAVLLLGACTATPTSRGPSAVNQPPARPAPSSSPAETLLPVSHWREMYDEVAPDVRRDSEQLSRSSDSWDFYTLAYSIDAEGSMFEATGDFSYARQALLYATNMMASARPSRSLPTSSFKDGYLGWVSADNDDDETPLYESYAWRYVTRLLRMLQPGLAQAPADIRTRYAAVLRFTEKNIVKKWLSRGADDYIYRSRTHMASHWAMIALDVSRLTSDPALQDQCLEIVSNIDDHLPNHHSSLRGQLRPNPREPDAYWWSDVWGDFDRPGQDVSHGNGVIAYVVESRDLDAGWTADELAHFSRTLTGFVLTTGDRHPEYVDGTGQDNGWISDGWVKLGRYDPSVQAVLETYPVQNDQYYAAMADNAYLLGRSTP